ncbi:phage holin [Cytobacillus praedii]|uniref:phage holin n=1 Tax=Cytobacillus praedii TaxID=1742358 RepID=UPI002E24C9D9|nr:phage holin [Cytobacillus praedii]
MKKDIVTLIGGFLTALFFFFGTIGISFEWFTQDSINAFVVLISAAIALGINLYAVYKNTYALTKKAKLQKEVLERHNLK